MLAILRVGLATMVLVGYFATGSIAVGGKIAIVNAVIGLSFYVVYERIWTNIGWGRNA